jgi:NADPH:quinone reductase-like Zn-dependent oxidoreductase
MDASVIGTSRTASKLEACRKFGLGFGIGTSDGTFSSKVSEATDGKGANVILDLVGASFFNENLAAAAKQARLLLVGLTSGSKAEFDMAVALHKRLKIIGTVLRARSTAEKAAATEAFARDVMPLLESSAVTPVVDRVFRAHDVAAAHAYLESDQSFGKVVLDLT